MGMSMWAGQNCCSAVVASGTGPGWSSTVGLFAYLLIFVHLSVYFSACQFDLAVIVGGAGVGKTSGQRKKS